MEEIKVIAMVDRSAGNDTVGEMWTETKIFSIHDSLNSIYIWASREKDPTVEDVARIKSNIKLSIAQ